MGNSESIYSYDKKAKMDKSLKDWLIKEFGNNKNIISRAPGAGFLVKTIKEFKGQKHYYFNIAAFFDPDNGFIMCLIKMYEQYLKQIKKLEKDKFITFIDLLSRPFEFILSFLGWKDDSVGLAILRNLYSMALGVAIGIGVGALSAILSQVHPLLGIATTTIALVIELNSLSKIKALEKIEKNQNELFSKIFNYFKSPNFINMLYEINIIEIVIDENSNSLLDGFFNKGVQINYWYIPFIENGKTLKELDERSKNFYCEIVKSMKSIEIKDALYKIKSVQKKYDEAYNKGVKNLNDINYCREELLKLNNTMPNDPAIQNLLQRLNSNQ